MDLLWCFDVGAPSAAAAETAASSVPTAGAPSKAAAVVASASLGPCLIALLQFLKSSEVRLLLLLLTSGE